MKNMLLNFVLVLVFGVAISQAQDSTVVIGYDWLDIDGNEQSVTNQLNADEGVYLDRLKFRSGGWAFDASGFGSKPYQRAELSYEKAGRYRLAFSFQKREHQVYDATYEIGMRQDDWSHAHHAVVFEYLGFKKLDLEVEWAMWNREGSISRPVFGLGIPYLIRRDFDDQNTEFKVALASKGLPVKLRFEQGLATYERDSSATPGLAVVSDDDVLLEVRTPGDDQRKAPSTSLSAYYEAEKWAFEFIGLYRKEQADILRQDFRNYGLGGGTIGQLGFLHDVDGESELDALQLRTTLGFKLHDNLNFKLRYHGQDQTTDNSSLELMQLIARGDGELIIESEKLVDSEWEKNDRTLDAELEFHKSGHRLSAAWGDRSREVSHQTPEHVNREERSGDQLKINWSYKSSGLFSSRLGASMGDYSHYLFRTQPEEVDRYWLRLRMGPKRGWSLSLRASSEQAVNPVDVSDLDRDQSQASVNLGYTTEKVMLNLGVGQQDFSSEIALDADLAPSIYDSELMFIHFSGSFALGDKARLWISANSTEDSGVTTPFSLTQLSGQLEIKGPMRTTHWLYVQSGSYENDLYATEDYDLTRVGYKLGWRF